MTVTDHSQATLESEALEVGSRIQNSRANRFQARGLENHPVPTGREEEWRFASLREIAPLFAANEPAFDTEALTYEVGEVEGLVAGNLGIGEGPRGTALVPEDRIAAAADELSANALHLAAPKNTALAEPVRVDIHGERATTPAYASIVLETGESSSATFILSHTGSALYGQNLELIVGDNSQMTVISIQDWADDAIHVGTHVASVGRDATLRHIVVSLGGRAVRINSTTSLVAAGGEVEQLGLYFADDHQHLEHRLFVDHAAPKCTSRVTYKGALQGRGARSVWVGDVLIRKAAEGTDTYELNRNLVLTEGARADSVPNLEIETGDIEGAGHAAATGRFDDEQLFYLRARGIPEAEARRLVVRGFFQELIQKIDVPEVREYLTEQIESELARSMS
ncbi:MAG: Fe-S cluster assembly protein SufD [Dermabacter sp.]|nr:Fe-S cluster assembly protein SufD [Dermabacter sp.]